jgi:hypothetical protein
MRKKMKRGDVIAMIVILILLMGVIVLSGIFYFNFVTGDFGATGHVVLSKSPDNSPGQINLPDKKDNVAKTHEVRSIDPEPQQH